MSFWQAQRKSQHAGADLHIKFCLRTRFIRGSLTAPPGSIDSSVARRLRVRKATAHGSVPTTLYDISCRSP